MKFFGGITSGPNKKDLGVVYPNETSSLFYFNNFYSIILKRNILIPKFYFHVRVEHDFKCSEVQATIYIFT